MTSTASGYADQAVTPTDLLARVRAHRAMADEAEAAILQLAVEWAHAHPALPGDESWRVTHRDATNFLEDPGHAGEEELEGYGIPEVHWAAPASFAAANGMSTTTGKFLLRDALILRHRLPRIYARVVAGQVQAWRARRIAQAVLGAPADVVAHIDATLGRHRPQGRPGDPDPGPGRGDARAARRRGRDRPGRGADPSPRHRRRPLGGLNHGVGDLYGRGDWKDLHDFDQALSAVAHKLKATPAGEHESFDTRRSMALGVLADPAQAIALLNAEDPSAPTKQIVLYVHLSDAAVAGRDPVGRNETNGARPWPSRSATGAAARTPT